LFNVSPGFEHTATIVFILVGVQVAADLPASGLLAVVEGAQRYGTIRAIDISDRIAWAGLSVILVWRGHGVTAIAAVSLVIALVVLLVTYVAAKRTEPSLRLDPRLMKMQTLRTTFRSSSSMMGIRVLGVVYSQMDRTVIGIMLAASAVASYEVAWKIHSLAAIVLGIAPSAVMPAAAYLHASSDRARLRDLYLRGTRYAVGLCLPLCVAGMIYAGCIIRTWVGPEYLDVTTSARLFLVYPALAIALVVGQSMLMGLGRMRRMLSFHAIAVALNLAISISLVHWLGIAGVIWGTIAAYVVLWVPFTQLFFKEFDVGLGEWTSHVLLPVVPAVVVQTLVGVASLQWVDNFDRLWQVGVVFVADYLVAVAVFLAIGGRGELSRLRAILSRPSVPAPST
jgi:O-antigen/teichoic acid export membrane protein